MHDHFTMKLSYLTIQRDLSYQAVPLRGPIRLLYKQPLKVLFNKRAEREYSTYLVYIISIHCSLQRRCYSAMSRMWKL